MYFPKIPRVFAYYYYYYFEGKIKAMKLNFKIRNNYIPGEQWDYIATIDIKMRRKTKFDQKESNLIPISGNMVARNSKWTRNKHNSYILKD